MTKKILSISALFIALSLQANAQSLKSEAKFWVKGNELKSNINLNGNAPIQDNHSSSLMTSLGENASNFYVVFQSLDSEATDLVDFDMKCYQHAITTKNINFTESPEIIKQKIETGAIVKYSFDLKNYKVTDEFMLVNNAKDQTYIYEVVYMNKDFSLEDHKHLQTYLSLKYGVTLLNTDNYLSSENEILWSNKTNSEFNKNIIGLGNSVFYDLNQTQSQNSIDKLLSISSHSLKNNEFILIGNNNKLNHFKTVENQDVLEKEYLVQTTSRNEESLNLNFNTKLIGNFSALKTYYLVLNDNTKIKGEFKNNELFFNDIKVNSNGNGIDRISIVSDSFNIKAELAEAWFLNDKGEITIKPEITKNTDKYEVSWFFNDKQISDKQEVLVNKTGVYEMKISSNNQEHSYKTTVYNNLNAKVSDEIKIYPNPILANQDFKISYDLSKISNIEIYIYQQNGKLVTKQNLGRTDSGVFDFKISHSGVYLLISIIDGKTNLNKLIVK